jgi:MFS family permease
VQGLGTAAILSLGVAMIGIAFPQHERGLAVSVYGLIGAAPAAFGPLIGGLLTDVASWRGVFLINLPLVAVMITVVALAWHEPERGSARSSFDARGLALLLASLVPLVLALMQAPVWGWGSSAVIGLLVVAGAALAAFVRVERRTPHPLIDLDVLRKPTVVGANLVLFCAQFSKIAVLVFGAFYLQDQLGMSALIAGAALLAAMVPTLLTTIWSGLLTDRLGSRRPTLAGVVGTTLSLALIAIAVPAGSYVMLLPGLVLWGVALPFLFNPAWTAVLNAVVAEKRGEVSGVTGTGRMLGSTLAVAVLGAVFVASGSFPAVFWIAAAVSATVWAAAFLLIERPPPARDTAPAPSRAG